ncbi:hypothetical protein [Glaciecola petra]|uniref:Uncharacterized protein n=1 Tax=Glaciecola petra TaxID=3075602 RepID=A0ABU2ZT54_9ALTE|nr:hypothetical protein [Aestuariibacter sp. P117]MDT0595818.1 hypothetical protein [Aestuariibacter sp. P117]
MAINSLVRFTPNKAYYLLVSESDKNMPISVIETDTLHQNGHCPISKPISKLKHSNTMSYGVTKVWVSYFCCWVCYTIHSKRKMNLIIRKNKFTESEFRSLCRIAIWH